MVAKRKRNRRDARRATTNQKTTLLGRRLPVSPSVSAATIYLWPLPVRWSGAQPAAPAAKSTVQKGLAPATKDSALRVAILPIQKVAAYTWCAVCEHLRLEVRPEARQALSAHAGWMPWFRCADKDSLRIRTEAWREGFHHSRKILPSYPRTSAAADRTVSALVSTPSSPVHLRSLVSSRKSPHQAQLALSERSREPRASSGARLLSASEAGTTGINSSRRRAKHHPPLRYCARSLPWQILALPQRFGSGTSKSSLPTSAPDAQERSRRARNPLIQAALQAPSMVERDILEVLAELPDPSETMPARWPGWAAPEYQLSPTQPVVRRSETGPPP